MDTHSLTLNDLTNLVMRSLPAGFQPDEETLPARMRDVITAPGGVDMAAFGLLLMEDLMISLEIAEIPAH